MNAPPATRLAPALLAVLALLVFASPLAARRPNVVVFLADDQGWGDLSLNGNTNLQTPHIDSLARDGVRFDRFFVQPVCSPTRAEFLTGRYHPRGGVRDVSRGGERLNLDELTIADMFRSAGYATAAFGKWHNGMQFPYHPNGRGFDEFYGFCSGHWGDYFSPPLDHNGRIVRGEGYVIDDFTNHAMRFMEEHRERPFFVYLPYCTPHSPMQVPDAFYDKFANTVPGMRNRDPEREDVPHTLAALAMCENIDWNVGRVLRKLDELELAGDTIVVYFSDNGPNGWRWNGDMRGRKGSTDEGGVRSPLVIRWPGNLPAGREVREISGAIDLLPTLAELADVDPPEARSLDGVSLKPLLKGESVEWPERTLFAHWNGRVSARTQRYRLDHEGRLYDLVADPGQRDDVADEHPATTTRLNRELAAWSGEMLPLLGEDERPFVIGHPDFPWTQIPARDADPHGGIKRSSRHPNCSYFTNWTALEDRITWEVEVAADGEFEVLLHYTCPPDDVGSTIELSHNDSRLVATITDAHDPPETGREHDRVERGESYVKDFREVSLGRIALKRGQGTLGLRALEIPGRTVVDFRLLMLRRVK